MNLDLTGLAEIIQPGAGEPLMLPLDMISCDPNQPRKHFDEPTLKELAESIRAIGVVQPVSARPDPAVPGRYILNYGERRYRASLIAGMQAIPAFVHKAPDDYKQVAENLHRADLSPMEMALFIKRRLDAGEKKNEIAAKLGYKNGYVTEHLALLEAPPCVEKAYANGATSARTLYDLRRLHDEFPQEVDAWCASGVEVTRDTVAALVQKFRRDEILDDVSGAYPSPATNTAPDIQTQSSERDEASIVQKFRRDEILDDVSSVHASPPTITAPDIQTQPSARDEALITPSTETRAASTSPLRDMRASGTPTAGQASARLFIKVVHDGRKATVEDDSIVVIRYDDGGTAEVPLAKTVVLGTASV